MTTAELWREMAEELRKSAVALELHAENLRQRASHCDDRAALIDGSEQRP